MNPDYEKKLAAQIDEALKGLSDLPAPSSLIPRVMAEVARRAAMPWYRQSWQMWPAPVRTGALVILLGSFGGLCFASWQLTRAAGPQLAFQEVAGAFSGVSVLYNAFVAVLNGLVIALRHVNPGILIGCLAVFALAWALFVGLGTACVKLALARRTGIGAVSDLFSGTVEPTGVSVLRRAND